MLTKIDIQEIFISFAISRFDANSKSTQWKLQYNKFIRVEWIE